MIELEERLRAALANLADELPPSRNPLAEHHRRLAVGTRVRKRRPMLAATAAALVLVGAVGPVALTRSDSPPVATPPSSTQASPPVSFDPGLDDPYASVMSEPINLATFMKDGREWLVWAHVSRALGEHGWEFSVCVNTAPNDSTRFPQSGTCYPVFYPLPDQPESKVKTVPVLGGRKPASGPLPGLLLFATVPEVTSLEVRAGDGTPVLVKPLVRIPELALFLADFGTSYEGFGYTARDSAGTVLESAIS